MEEIKQIRVRGHELRVLKEYFILGFSTNYIMKGANHEQEYLREFEELMEGLKPNDYIIIVDKIGTFCELTENGCRYNIDDKCSFMKEHNLTYITDLCKFDRDCAELRGFELNKPYTLEETIKKL